MLPGWTLFEVRRDWPGWTLVTLGTLGPELTMVGRVRLSPGTDGRDTETREGPGVTPALVTRSGRYRGQRECFIIYDQTYSL